jgi:cytochrome b6-f complex iron-sulfur subunit
MSRPPSAPAPSAVVPGACGHACPLHAPAVDSAAWPTRRDFLSVASLAAASALLAACGGGATEPAVPAGTTLTVRLADQPALAEVGGIALLALGPMPIAVVRTGETAFVAVSRICTHAGGTVAPDAARRSFVCPVHGATYDLAGRWIGGQSATDLRTYPTRYDAATATLVVG